MVDTVSVNRIANAPPSEPLNHLEYQEMHLLWMQIRKLLQRVQAQT